MNEKNQESFINGTIWLSISAIILKIIGLIYKIPISYLLDDEGMGIFNSAYTVYTFFYIIGSAGIPKGIAILTSKFEAEKKGSSIVIYRTAFFVIGIAAILLTVLFFVLSGPLSYVIGNKASMLSMLCISPTILFVTLSGVLRGYFSGKMKFSEIAISELISGISKLLLGLLFAFYAIKSNFNLEIVCALSILGITFGAFFGFIYLYVSNKRYDLVKSDSKKIELRYMKDILWLAAPITFSAALGSAVNILDLSMIIKGLTNSGYSDSVATSLYGNYTTLTVPMIGVVTSLINPISMSVQPLLTKNFFEKDNVALSVNINSCFEIISFISLPCFVGFSFFSCEILSIIFEYESAVLAAPMLTAIAPSLLFIGILTVINTAFEADRMVGIPMISLGVGAIVKLIFGGFLTYRGSLGILSAPIGTVISYFVSLIISFVMFKRIKKIKIFPLKHTLKYLSFSLLAAVPLLLFKYLMGIAFENKILNAIIVLLYGLLYIVFSLIFSKNARKNVLKFVKMHKKA